MRDELRDRFGEIPNAVEGLIDIALIRNIAFSLGVYEIRQNETSLLLYINSIKSEGCGRLLQKLRGQALLNAGNKPYIAVRFPKNMEVIDALKAIFSF